MALRVLGRAAFAAGVFLLHAAAAVPGDEPPPREGDTVAWHVVQPGDTFQRLARQYLGDQALWPENLRLNPGRNSTQLRVGSRVRVVVARKPRPRTADVRQISRRVDAQFQPRPPWVPAKPGDQLREKDGIRTHERSSAELAFDDGAQLLVTEQSLVFIRDVGTTLRGVPRESIEIVEGQVDLSQRPKRASPEIEIVVAETRARPKPSASGSAATRARKAETGSAMVMSYQGTSEVEAVGHTVEVLQGMGTTVPRGLPPRPPERLLAGPRVTDSASRFGFANPVLRWEAAAGAVSYTVEACGDAECARLVSRATGITATSWRAEGLSKGSYLWRVAAVSASGLDGYASRPRSLELTSDQPDLEPPVVFLAIEGQGAAESDNRVVLGPRAAIRLVAQDDASGVASVRYRWDGGSWKDAAGLLEPPSPEEHRLDFQATDAAERQSKVWSVTIVAVARPAPPNVRSELPNPREFD